MSSLALLIALFAVTPDSMQHPGLLLKTNQPGIYVEAPTVSTNIDLRVRGIVARGVVRQRFENTTDHCVEALYVFPLADDATVDAMRMKIGVRTIEGEIKERGEAKQAYEQARSEGRQASLLEQHRPNLFTVSVASLPAGETAEIEIEYQQIAEWDDGKFSLRVPLAVAPRYSTSTTTGLPEMVHAVATKGRNPVTLSVDLESGIALDTIVSPTHQLDEVRMSESHVTLKPRDVTIASDRDFELCWSPRLGATPKFIELTEKIGGDRYTLVMGFAAREESSTFLPREAIFIIDTSGSMGGPSIDQAKKALVTALHRLRPSHRFNVIEFNSTARAIFTTSRPADRATVDEAIRWVSALEADGGTEMMSALEIALEDRPIPAGSVRQVVFITDGQVGNEPQVFDFIRAHLGNTRLFTIGIGSAPNTFFMRNAARAGRGTFTQIGDLAAVEEVMSSLFRKLESPVQSNVTLSVAGGERWPKDIPDLYAGEPLVVVVKNADRLSAQSVTGEGTGIAKLWARRKIDALRDSVFAGANADSVRADIVQLALEHHIVTEHTSLVAVDTTPAGVDPKSCTSELVPLNLPAGWGGMEGTLPQTATGGALSILLGSVALAAAVAMRRMSS
jgi:Ca-activated chloride channel family protein